MGRKSTVVRTETTADDVDEARELREKNLEVPLFADLGDTEDDRVEKLHVIREDPDEGFVGVLEGTATELDVFRQWGGSKYSIQAKNGRGRVVTRRTLKLAGDPIFLSEVFEARWRKQNGVKPKDSADGGPGAMSPRELMALIETKAEAAKREAEEREERRRREDGEREEKNRREEREWRDRVEKDKADRELRLRTEEREHRERMETQRREDDKRREDQRRDEERSREARSREDDQRREKEHERQLQMASAAAERAQKETQTFFTNMLAMAKQDGGGQKDPLEMATTLVSLATALKGDGGEPKDAVQAFIEKLPETIREARLTARQAMGEGGGGDGDEDGEEGQPSGKAGLTLPPGPLTEKMKELIMHLVKRGKDPRVVLTQAADAIMGKTRNLPAQPVPEASKAKRRRPMKKRPVRASKVKVAPATPAKAAAGPSKPAGAP